MTAPPPRLAVEKVTVVRGGSVVLQDLSLDVEAGEIRLLLGPNSSGKSTLLQAIGGMLPVSKGRIVMDGSVRLDTLPSWRRRRMGVWCQLQHRRLFNSLTVGENLDLFLLRLKRTDEDSARQRFIRAVDRHLDLSRVLQQRAETLSGGQTVLISLALALASNCGVILLDEPLQGLAPPLAESARQLIRETAHRDNASVLVAEHPSAELEDLGGRITRLGRDQGHSSLSN